MPFSQAQFSYALFNTTCSLLTSKKAWQHMVLKATLHGATLLHATYCVQHVAWSRQAFYSMQLFATCYMQHFFKSYTMQHVAHNMLYCVWWPLSNRVES